MGLLDEALKQFTQGGQGSSGTISPWWRCSRSCCWASAGGQSAAATAARLDAAGRRSGQAARCGTDIGGLGGLLAQLQAAGLDDVVKSWVGTGQNKPVQPDELGDALGKKAVTQMADKAGCSQDDLLTQLSKALPGLIDKLTHDGRIPTQQEINQRLTGRG